jgi:pyrimidine operon attenuation protein/uracil phosphoribosyltransferase
MSREFNQAESPRGLTFVPEHQVLNAEEVARAVTRMAHEIIERNHGDDRVSVIGLQTGGGPFATKLSQVLEEIAGHPISSGMLDVSFYRDDLSRNPVPHSSATTIDHDLTSRNVVLVDDVLFTGRTIRAALNALSDWGRPKSVQLAVLVDRGHRELPIRPDYVGKNLPTSLEEEVLATLDGVWIGKRLAS